MACADRRIARRRRSACSAASHRPGPPWHTRRPAGRLACHHPVARRPWRTVRSGSGCAAPRAFFPAARSALLAFFPAASLLFECLPGVLAGCAAAEILRSQRTDQGKGTDDGCDGRCGDFRVHKRNLLRVATAATQKIAFGRIHGRGNRSAKSCGSRVVSRRTGALGRYMGVGCQDRSATASSPSVVPTNSRCRRLRSMAMALTAILDHICRANLSADGWAWLGLPRSA